jgi:ubiquinone/menaquinone biosynthesis C-methylase UbiE
MTPIAALSDRRYVAEQYRNADNLNARITLHRRFSTNPYGWIRWVFDQLHIPTQCRILELGSGPGDLWLENLDRIPALWTITISDSSPGMAHQARRNLAGGAHPFQFRIIDAQAIPYKNESFDVVIANHMLYHVPDKDRVFSEIHRVLKAGGRFYASTIGWNHIRELGELISRFDPDLASWGWRSPDSFLLENGAAQIAKRFTQVELRRYADSLIVTEAAPLVDYLLSGRIETAVENREKFAKFVERELVDCGGAFHVTKDSGLFEAVR